MQNSKFSLGIRSIRQAKGFTLIELIITMSILAILVGFVVAILDPFTQFQKGRDARRKSDLSQLQKALEQYYQDHQQYPPSGGAGNTYEVMDTSTSPATPIPWGGTTPVWQKYIEVMPKDPDQKKHYVYLTDGTGQMYWVYASLDRVAKDPDACPNGVCSNIQGASCGSSSCNFGLSSPNTNP